MKQGLAVLSGVTLTFYQAATGKYRYNYTRRIAYVLQMNHPLLPGRCAATTPKGARR